MYVISGSKGSRIIRVLWMLEELGEDYEMRLVKPASPEAFALNPTGRVPVLSDGDLALTDSAAICLYLGEIHAAAGMAAGSQAELARMNAFLHFIQSELEMPMWNKLKHRLLLPEHLRLEVGPWVGWEFARDAEALSKRLGGKPFAMGGRFTAVDAVLGHVLQWAGSAKFGPLPQNVADYAARMQARPALARARAREAAC